MGKIFRRQLRNVCALLLVLAIASCGGNSGSTGNGGNGGGGAGGGGGGGESAPATPGGLTATAGNQQVSLNWNASAGATSYNVGRSITSGGAYSQIASPSATSYSDTSVTNGTTYYYVVAAVNSAGMSANSAEVSAKPVAPSAAISVNINVLADRHLISPYVYGGAFPKNASTITDSGLTVVRWGGNASSTYNWRLGTDNADNDYYFEDYSFGALNNSADSDSTQFIKDVKAAGSNPLMTMAMLPWVAQSPETSTTQGGADNYHWVFSVSQDGACASNVDQYNTDAGVNLKSDCATTMVASAAQINRAYYPLLDGPPQSGDPANAVYRNQWAAALATAFGNASSCPVPYFPSLTSCHFYDMDNEIDIWGGTHVDIHPNPSGYGELRDVYLTEARNLKSWDPAAVRLGPVSCCWWFYWNGANGNDKGAHAGVDFLPWWLNEIYWQDQIAGTRSLDIFDVHAYPDGPDTSSMTQAQKQALAVSIYRDYWDPTLVSPSGTIDQQYTTTIQPNKTIAFRIPRMRAMVNSIYPGTPLAFTEWSAEFAGASDFSTALGDADAYGILGRERVSLATRWTAPDPANPNYQALKLYTNYDGAHHGFGSVSVSATHNADPDLFSVYAATNSAGNSMMLMVINKDPANAASANFALNGFTATQFASYTLSQSSPTNIVAGPSQAWSSNMTFAPYSATLLVVGGSSTAPPSEWDLNPDTIMVPAGGSATLSPKLTSGTATINLTGGVFDSFEGAAACGGGSITLTNPSVAANAPGEVTVNAPATPGFCHFTMTGSDGTTKGGWLVVGNPPASLAKTSGDQQTGTAGSALANPLVTTLSAGQSGGSATGACVLFTASAGTLSTAADPNAICAGANPNTGTKIIAVTNNSGQASVTLTLPASPGTVSVTAEGQYALGHPQVTFTATAH